MWHLSTFLPKVRLTCMVIVLAVKLLVRQTLSCGCENALEKIMVIILLLVFTILFLVVAVDFVCCLLYFQSVSS